MKRNEIIPGHLFAIRRSGELGGRKERDPALYVTPVMALDNTSLWFRDWRMHRYLKTTVAGAGAGLLCVTAIVTDDLDDEDLPDRFAEDVEIAVGAVYSDLLDFVVGHDTLSFGDIRTCQRAVDGLAISVKLIPARLILSDYVYEVEQAADRLAVARQETDAAAEAARRRAANVKELLKRLREVGIHNPVVAEDDTAVTLTVGTLTSLLDQLAQARTERAEAAEEVEAITGGEDYHPESRYCREALIGDGLISCRCGDGRVFIESGAERCSVTRQYAESCDGGQRS